MRQVAGTLRLDLAQYRELAAFAQFGSDLDKASAAQLNRGRHLVEILKQGQYQPVPVEEQIMIIHAGTSGALDDFPTKRIQEFEVAFRALMRESHPEIGKEIVETRQVSDKAKSTIDAAIQSVKKQMVG
jgi:F-type H+-transporting ATPase subunit alpha